MELILREEGIAQIYENAQLAEQRISTLLVDKELKTWGVGKNTIRAFHNYSGPPLIRYRTWSNEYFQTIKRVSTPHSREGFLKFHGHAVESLTNHWNREEGDNGKNLAFPYSHKLVDLFFKHIARHGDLFEETRQAIIYFSNTPIDKYSLMLLQACYYGIIILPKPAMGNITRLEDYHFLQDLIQELMTALTLPASYFDYVAWEPFH